MNYTLNKPENKKQKPTFTAALRRLLPFMSDEKSQIALGFGAILITSVSALVAPALIGHTVDAFIRTGNFSGVLEFSSILFGVYILWVGANYLQIKTMGAVGRRVLFKLRNALFNKLQELPVAFFNQNKTGDLISRINNDTDQLNQFFAQALMQFIGSFFLILGTGIFILILDFELGVAALLPALGVLVITQVISPWVKRRNLKNLQALGGLSAEIQESLNNFKVIIAFNRLDYFKQKFDEANQNNFTAAVGAGIANNIFTPIYGFSSNLAQLIVLGSGIYLISIGQLTVGLLIGFLLYVNNFYNPLRQLASIWASFQQAMAGIDRISEVLDLGSDMAVTQASDIRETSYILEFKNVHFGYPDGVEVLKAVNFSLEKGKTYALVGPTGGGKTTTASLMARLYDPTRGTIMLDGQDIRSYDSATRTQKIGFILQEPFLFTGTVRDNILYGNERYAHLTDEELRAQLEKADLVSLLARFEKGLATPITVSGDAVSLGQKQLLAFMRAILRDPELLILDEATANIDTVTEQLLEELLRKLPASTTKVIIAHRLNTISSADEIFFVNSGEIVPAGSMEHAVEMLLQGKRET